MSGVLVHEWLSVRGGSENVFEVLSGIFPDAARFCLWNASEGRFTDVGETWLARTPLKGRKALALPLMPLAWRSLPRVDAEWVLCSSHLFAHHARFKGSLRDAPKLVYAHTPARYVWEPEMDGRGVSPVARTASAALKPLDRRRAREATSIVANSAFIADRIARTWELEARVIHPPVDIARFSEQSELIGADQQIADALPSIFLLGVSRYISYKRLDLVIQAGAATGLPVVLAGAGPEENALRAFAETHHPNRVTFVRNPSATLLATLYRRASAVVFPPIEDFGIVPVEAMAAGTPVVANTVGGARESVLDAVTGSLVSDWTRHELKTAVEIAMAADPDACRRRAADFAPAEFERKIRRWVGEVE